MTVSLSLFAGAGAQFFDNNGDVLSGGKIYTYAAGTTSPATTYTDNTGAIAQTNPIILTSAGRVSSGEIWLTDGNSYKFILTDSNDVSIASYDNVLAGLSTGSVSTSTLADNAVTTAKIADGSVTPAKLSTGHPTWTTGGNFSVGGTLTVTGDSTLTGNVSTSGTYSGTLASTVTATTQTASDNSTKVATTAFVKTVTLGSKIQPLDASTSAGSLTVSLNPTTLDFRPSTALGGPPTTVTSSSTITVTAAGAATLGFVNNIQGRIAVLAIYASGTVELALCNANNGGISFDESSLISTSNISAGTSASTVYSTTARSNVPYRIVGYIEASNQSSAWYYSYVQGAGGQSVTRLSSLVTTATQTVSSFSIQFSSIPYGVKRITIVFDKVALSASDFMVVIGSSTYLTSYQSSSSLANGTTTANTTGFIIKNNTSNTFSGIMTLHNINSTDWVSSHTGTLYGATSYGVLGGGNASFSGVSPPNMLSTIGIYSVSGTGTFTAGTINLYYE